MGVFCVVSCGDEDDPVDVNYVMNKDVAGSYTGWTHLTTTYINKKYTGDTFVLTLAEDGTLTATYSDGTWGTATIKGLNAKWISEGEGYSIESGEGTFVMNNPRAQTTEEYACKLDYITISADKSQLAAVLSVYMEVGHGNMTFTFQTGEAPAEE